MTVSKFLTKFLIHQTEIVHGDECVLLTVHLKLFQNGVQIFKAKEVSWSISRYLFDIQFQQILMGGKGEEKEKGLSSWVQNKVF